MRLFVALDLPAHAVKALSALEVDTEVWRRLRPETLHLTLAFLGERPESDVEAIRAVVEREHEAPALRFTRVIILPRVLAAELSAVGLVELQSRVSEGLAAAGVYKPERRAFRAHVTIARLRPRTRRPQATAAELKPLAFHAEAVTLYASRLHSGGATYEALATAPLTAP